MTDLKLEAVQLGEAVSPFWDPLESALPHLPCR